MGINPLTPAAAFVAGLAVSPHCLVMCGPLACALRTPPSSYHGGRLLSYTFAGAVIGWLGQGLLGLLEADASRILPWVLTGSLVLIACGWEKRLPWPKFFSLWLLRLRLNRTLGIFTPLLPCGPLWLMLAAAAATGSAFGGAALMAAFVAGTIPFPFLIQAQASRLRIRFSSRALEWGRRAVALFGAGLLAWRALLPVHGLCH